MFVTSDVSGSEVLAAGPLLAFTLGFSASFFVVFRDDDKELFASAGSDDPDAGARADERAGTHRVDLDGTRPRALRNADRDDSPHVAQPQPVRYDGDG